MKRYLFLLLLTISVKSVAMTTEETYIANQQKIDTLNEKMAKEKPLYIHTKLYGYVQQRRLKKRNNLLCENIAIEIESIKKSPDTFADSKWAKAIPYVVGMLSHAISLELLQDSVDDDAPRISKGLVNIYALATEVIFIVSIFAAYITDNCFYKWTKDYKIKKLTEAFENLNDKTNVETFTKIGYI